MMGRVTSVVGVERRRVIRSTTQNPPLRRARAQAADQTLNEDLLGESAAWNAGVVGLAADSVEAVMGNAPHMSCFGLTRCQCGRPVFEMCRV